jgi:hypothetical protein
MAKRVPVQNPDGTTSYCYTENCKIHDRGGVDAADAKKAQLLREFAATDVSRQAAIVPQPVEADLIAIAEGHFNQRENPTAWEIVREERENPQDSTRAGFFIIKNKVTGTHFGVYAVKDLTLDEITYTNLTGQVHPVEVEIQTWQKSGATRTFTAPELAEVEVQLEAELNGASSTPGRYALETWGIWDTEPERDLIDARFHDTETGQRYSGTFEHYHQFDEVTYASYLPAHELQQVTTTKTDYQKADGTPVSIAR